MKHGNQAYLCIFNLSFDMHHLNLYLPRPPREILATPLDYIIGIFNFKYVSSWNKIIQIYRATHNCKLLMHSITLHTHFSVLQQSITIHIGCQLIQFINSFKNCNLFLEVYSISFLFKISASEYQHLYIGFYNYIFFFIKSFESLNVKVDIFLLFDQIIIIVIFVIQWATI